MARISFTPNLARHLSVTPADLAPGPLHHALAPLFNGNPRLRGYLLDEHGRLRRHVSIFVNGTPIADRDRLTDGIGPHDEVFVFQALSGG